MTIVIDRRTAKLIERIANEAGTSRAKYARGLVEGLRLLAIRMATRLTREEERREKRCRSRFEGVQSYGLA